MASGTLAQTSNATLHGTIVNEKGVPMEMVSIALRDFPFGTTSKKNGEFNLSVPSNRNLSVVFSYLGYEMVEKEIRLESGSRLEVNITMKETSRDVGEVVVTDRKQVTGNITRIDPKILQSVTGVSSGSMEGILTTLPGVISSNELSNQYSVRGGSFDENLVYVNDIEIYRPFLVRSGQQEGMSFVNSDMVSSVEFSAGGFDARFGDKMSSVLNIIYKKPNEFKSSISASLLGATAQFEDASKNGKLTYNMGLRYKTFQYLYGTLGEVGEYRPRFLDYQGYFTYSFNKAWELGLLGSVSLNNYTFVPQSKSTDFGTWSEARNLMVYFDGQEVDLYQTNTLALSIHFQPNPNFYLKLIASAFNTHEEETFDIIGYYNFNELGRQPGTEEFGDSILNLGAGMYHEHGRNFIDAEVLNLTHKGGLKLGNHLLQWGVTFKQEYISDRSKEWEYRDSAGYSLPYSDTKVELYKSSRTQYSHTTNRYAGFIQDSYQFATGFGEAMVTAGLRAHYWDFNGKWTVSPRASATLRWGYNHKVESRLSAGWYHQPAFFRELKDLAGNINYNIPTPRSFQVVAGTDYSFIAWDRPFRLTGELYYKAMKNLIPYQYENVRIRYLSDKISDGFATGADLKINGEFVSGTQSWASMSLMGTYEDIANDGHGYIPRPSDQRFKFSLFFQDYFPLDPNYQMNLTGHLITGMPYGPPKTDRYLHTGRIKAYRRVDIGFSRTLVGNGSKRVKWDFIDKLHLQECTISLDVFNIIDIKNVSSYTWIADFAATYYPVPNELTGRLFNIRLNATF